MKIANFSPLLKSGDGHDMTNYRPISELYRFSKILERAMHNRLSDFMESNAILYNKQFGFRKNHSATHAIIEVADKITEALEQHKITLVVAIWYHVLTRPLNRIGPSRRQAPLPGMAFLSNFAFFHVIFRPRFIVCLRPSFLGWERIWVVTPKGRYINSIDR